MQKSVQKAAIIYGGESSEHEATRKSFEYLYERVGLKGLRSDLQLINIVYLTRDGKAVISEYDKSKNISYYERRDNDVSTIDAFKFLIDKKLFVFGVFYGQNGEDGRVQGVADFFSMQTNFGGIISCALGMSKYHLNQYVKGNFPNVKVPETVSLRRADKLKEELARLKGKEIVVKPNSLGSSVMTEKFLYNDKSYADIEKLITSILKFDVKVLIQEYVKGIEYSCACLEKDNQVLKLPAMRIETANNFFGQKEKFIEGYSKEIIVEEKDDTPQLKKAKEVARQIYLDLDFRNGARFDFIFTENDIYFLEANPLPGILKGSIFTKMLRTKGWDVENLIEISFDNEKNRKKMDTEFHFEIAQ